jgi:hypothetical protein
MEAASIPHPVPEDSSDATRDGTELFRYSTWVHAGRGAAECEHAQDGACQDSRHFHAWVRLPNQFQHEDIRERALAAKARRMRQLRDPETDAYVILEADMAELERVADRAAIVDELVNKDWWKRPPRGDARGRRARGVRAHPPRPRTPAADLAALPRQAPADERDELSKSPAGLLRGRRGRPRAELQAPRRQAIERSTTEKLIEQIREERINAEATAAFMETTPSGSGSPAPSPVDGPAVRARRYDAIEQLEDEAPEIIDALRDAFNELERSSSEGRGKL